MNKKRTFKHLSSFERGRIAEMYEGGSSYYAIGKKLGRSASTIRAEIKRGTVKQIKQGYKEIEKYFPEAGQYRYEQNRKACMQPYRCMRKECKNFIQYVEHEILENRQSVDGAIGRAKKMRLFSSEEMVCTTTFYSYIEKQLVNVRNIDLPLRVRYRKKKKIVLPTQKRIFGTSIEKRPEEVERRRSFGHWEIDLVIGKLEKDEVLLVLTERKTRKEFIEKIKNKTNEEVRKGLYRIFTRVGQVEGVFRTITSDNGSEFSRLHELEQSRNIQVYYAHPYAAYERGSNERNNGLIRYRIPKYTSIKRYSKRQIAEIEEWINKKPRRIFGYLTADEMFEKEISYFSSA